MKEPYGNWQFLCNFVGIKQILEDYIRQTNEIGHYVTKSVKILQKSMVY